MPRLILANGIFFVGVIFFARQVSYKRPSYVYAVFYSLSLSINITVVLIAWAYMVRFIDEHGVYQGKIGQAIPNLLDSILDLASEVKLVLSFLSLIILPQLTAYILSGLFGSAWKPLLISKGIRFGFWFIVKSLPTISGVLIGLALAKAFFEWPAFDKIGIARVFTVSTSTIFLTFVAISTYFEADELVNVLPSWLKAFCQRRHRWFTRRFHVPRKSSLF